MKKSSFQFTNPVLLRLDFQINEDFSSKDSISVPIQFQVQKSTKDQTEKMATVKLSVTVGEKTNNMPYYISATICANFKWEPDSYSEEAVDNLLSQNAPALLLSYIRPIIANITNSSPYPVNNLPFFDFTQTSEK